VLDVCLASELLVYYADDMKSTFMVVSPLVSGPAY
jgi:hypothetical protein